MKVFAKIVLIVAIFFAGLYIGGTPALSPSNGSNAPAENEAAEVSVMLDYGDGTLKTFKGIDVTASTTVLDVLKQVTASAKIEFAYKEYGDLGAMVESIDGRMNDLKNDRYWQFWVNNVYSTAGASVYRLNAGDVIEWKYIKGQFTQ